MPSRFLLPLLLLVLTLVPGKARAQDAPAVLEQARGCDSVQVRYIVLTGNSITKRHIILRELGYDEGQTLAVQDTAALFRTGRNRVFNTRLFVTVAQNVIPLAAPQQGCPQPILIELQVKERWYIFPFPILELADRSINEWLYNHGADLRRINYGLRIEANNLRGRNETLKLIGQYGFTRKLEASYTIPYLSRRLKEGLYLEAQYVTNNQIAARSEGNKQFFIQNFHPVPLYERFRTGAEFSYRPLYWITHRIGADYTRAHISDTIAKAAPDFFLDARTRQEFFHLRYGFTYDRRDIRQYPLKGFYLSANVERFGLLPQDGVHLWSGNMEASQFTPLGGRWYLANGITFTASTPGRQPYAQARFLGFGQQFVRGYEKYVMESPVNGVLKNTLRYRLFAKTVHLESMPIRQFSTFPFAIYLKAFADGGYARNPLATPGNTRLLNTWLGGTGLGVDFVTYYDYVLRLEYSFNRQGENALYFHVAVEI